MTEQEKQPTHGAKVRLDRAQEQAQEQGSRCLTIYQTPETNKAFYSVNAKEAAQEFVQLTLDGYEASHKTTADTAVTINDYIAITDGLKESSKKLLDYVTGQLAATNSKDHSSKNYAVLIDIHELAQLYGRDVSTESKLKEFRKALNNDLDTLYKMSITIKDNKGNKLDLRVCEAKGIAKGLGKSGVYMFAFGHIFADYLINRNLITPLPLTLFTASSKPLSFPLGRYLAIRYNMDTNAAAKTNDIVSIKALLEQFPEYFPASKSGRNWTARIKDKLEAALDELQEVGVLHWAYCKAKKEVVEDEPATYKEFLAAYIHFDILDTPDGSERRKRKAIERKQKAQRKAKAKARAIKAAADSGQMHLTDE